MLLLICATDLEAVPFIDCHNLTRQKSHPLYRLYGRGETALLVTGMGSIRGALSLSDLVDRWRREGIRVSRIINYGIAGCLSDAWGIGDVVEIDRVIKYSAHEYTGKERSRHFLSAFPDLILNSAGKRENTLATSDHPVFNRRDSKRAGRYAQLVDMEGYGYVFAAQHHTLPIKVLKGVSDYTFKRSDDSFNKNVHRALYNLLAYHREREVVESDAWG